MIIEKLPVVLLSTMAAEKSTSTNHLIASYILSHPDEAADMGIQQLAEACYVGTGSVSRFVREIGLLNYNELRSLLKETQFRMDHSFLQGSAENRRSSFSSFLSEALIKAERSVNQKQLEKLCADIRAYESVYAFGLLKAESAAISLQSDLLMMGKNIYTAAAYADQIETIRSADKKDLILIFSYTGTYFSSHSFREKEKRLLLPKIWMICGTKEKVPWFVDETLRFESEGRREAHPFLLEMAASLISQEYAYQSEQQKK